MFNTYQKAALTGVVVGYATQMYAQYKINQAVKNLMEVNEGLADSANRSTYVVMYLMTKALESGVEFDEFDMRVLQDPPKAFDPELPNLYTEFFSRFINGAEITEEDAEEFMKLLRGAREGNDDDA
jgi:hypothetical protein